MALTKEVWGWDLIIPLVTQVLILLLLQTNYNTTNKRKFMEQQILLCVHTFTNLGSDALQEL
jgi:hypothetical protein